MEVEIIGEIVEVMSSFNYLGSCSSMDVGLQEYVKKIGLGTKNHWWNEDDV